VFPSCTLSDGREAAPCERALLCVLCVSVAKFRERGSWQCGCVRR
jgi:hypothetical protein